MSEDDFDLERGRMLRAAPLVNAGTACLIVGLVAFACSDMLAAAWAIGAGLAATGLTLFVLAGRIALGRD